MLVVCVDDIFEESLVECGIGDEIKIWVDFNTNDIHLILDVMFGSRNLVTLDEYAKMRINEGYHILSTDKSIDLFRCMVDKLEDLFRGYYQRSVDRMKDDWEITSDGRRILFIEREWRGPSPFVNPFTYRYDN